MLDMRIIIGNAVKESKTLCTFGESETLAGVRLPLGDESDAKCAVWMLAGHVRLFGSEPESVQYFSELRKSQIALDVKHYHGLLLAHEVDHSLRIAGHEGRRFQLSFGLPLYFGHALLWTQSIPHDDGPEMFIALESFLESGHFLPNCLVLFGEFLQPSDATLVIQLYFSKQTIVVKANGLPQSILLAVDGTPKLGVQLIADSDLIGHLCVCLIQQFKLMDNRAVNGVSLLLYREQVNGGILGSVFLAMNGQTVPAQGEEALGCPAEVGDGVGLMEGAGSGRAFEKQALHDNNSQRIKINQSLRPPIFPCQPSLNIYFLFGSGGVSLDGLLVLNATILLDQPLSGMRQSHVNSRKRSLCSVSDTLFGWQGSASCQSRYSMSVFSDLQAAQ